MSNGNKGNNSNRHNPFALENEVLKIVVVGESGCGKTTFIRTAVREFSPGPETSMNGVIIYSCELPSIDSTKRVNFYEIPSDPLFTFEQGTPYYENAHVVIFMYAVDDPSSLEKLSNKWIFEIIDIVIFNSKAAALVGNKNDLLSDREVITRLALNNQVPVTREQVVDLIPAEVRRSAIYNISSFNSDEVSLVFNSIRAFHFSQIYNSIRRRGI